MGTKGSLRGEGTVGEIGPGRLRAGRRLLEIPGVGGPQRNKGDTPAGLHDPGGQGRRRAVHHRAEGKPGHATRSGIRSAGGVFLLRRTRITPSVITAPIPGRSPTDSASSTVVLSDP